MYINRQNYRYKLYINDTEHKLVRTVIYINYIDKQLNHLASNNLRYYLAAYTFDRFIINTLQTTDLTCPLTKFSYSLASCRLRGSAPIGMPCLCRVSITVSHSSLLYTSKSNTLLTTFTRPSFGYFCTHTANVNVSSTALMFSLTTTIINDRHPS